MKASPTVTLMTGLNAYCFVDISLIELPADDRWYVGCHREMGMDLVQHCDGHWICCEWVPDSVLCLNGDPSLVVSWDA